MSSELREIWTDAGGRAPAHWSFVRFEDLLAGPKSIAVGVMYPGSHDESGVPLIKVSDVKNGAVVAEPAFRISELVNHEYRRTSLCGNELLITLVGNPGDCAIVDDSMAGWNAARALAVVRVKDPTIRPWLRYVLLSSTAKHLIDARLNTTVQKTLNLKDIRSLPIPIAPQSERNAIVETAAALENKINVNLQINQTLEQMAQAIFKSWFVDFEPVKAKIAALEAGGNEEDALLAAMRVISGTSLFDADASAAGAQAALTRLQAEQPEQYAELRATAKLFPSAMQDSELGEIPEGWSVSQIGDEVTVVGGGTPSTKNPIFWEGGRISWTSPKDLSNLVDKVLVETERKITEAGLAKISSGLLPINTVLMSSRAPVGYLAMAKIPVAVNQGYIAMKCEKVLSPEFVIQWCEAHMDEIKSRASGTTFAEISKKNFKIIPVVVPPESLMSAYTRQVLPLYEAIEINVRESDNLAQLRDTLLPKLLSGELSLTTTVFEPDSRNVADATA